MKDEVDFMFGLACLRNSVFDANHSPYRKCVHSTDMHLFMRQYI